jgi:hypothetical protein
MTATIQKWGNSLALLIPLAVAKQIQVKEVGYDFDEGMMSEYLLRYW